MTIFDIKELDVAHVTDEQAAAIGRLALSFNFLESCIDEAISFIISPRDASGIGVLTDRLGFDAKVSRLEAIVKHYRHSLAMPNAAEATADQIHTWAVESIGQLPTLLKRLRDAAEFRNRLVHSKIKLKHNQRHGTLVSRAGVEIASDPSTISAEARRMGGLGIAVAMFGQQFHGSVRNFKQLRARRGKP
jgi:hypothetical protein